MRNAFIMAVLFLALLSGCKKNDGGPVGPPVTTAEDWSFPANATKFALTLYAPKQTVAVGDSFEVRAVCYNVTSLFGAAVEVACPNGKAQVKNMLAGPFFTPDSLLIGVVSNDTTSHIASIGVTFEAGSNKTLSGSGALFKLKCKATSAGAATFTVNAAKLELVQSDGNSIPNFAGIQVENCTVTVQ